MNQKQEIYINAFTRLSMDGVLLGEMQIANPRLTYQLSDADRVRPEIDIVVRVVSDQALVREVFSSPETGYFEKHGRFYYRNCNMANAMSTPDVFYKGRLPNSFLHIHMEVGDSVRIAFSTTRNFVREGRSRLTRIASIDQAVNDVALAVSVFRGYLPFHGAAIEAGPPDRRYSLIFMGLPNTGKTSTSVAAGKALGADYLAEDICFVAPESLSVFSGPYTLDETKMQNYDALRSTKYRAAPLAAIVMLERTAEPETVSVIPAGDPKVRDFILGMNRYEFEWNHDIFVRHLMIGGESAGFSIPKITRGYFAGLERIADRVPAIRLSGQDPLPWSEMLVAQLGKQGFIRQ
jgi:hypothetical protein